MPRDTFRMWVIRIGLADVQVERRLTEESNRIHEYLSSITDIALQELLVEHLLTHHLQSILHMPGSGLVTMLDQGRIPDLRRLYSLFLRVPNNSGKDALRIALRMDIEERGKAINQNAISGNEAGPSGTQEGEQPGMDVDGDDPKGKGKAKAPANNAASAMSAALRWVQEVLDLKDKFDSILDQAFSGDKAVQGSINEAFQSFINGNPRAPEHLSLFIDEHLKKGTKAVCALQPLTE